nr:hypothetical protein [uncultured Carboxylicivirga sp.]
MKKNQLFLIVKGNNQGHLPNYGYSQVSLQEKDPAEIMKEDNFICSSIFSFTKEGNSIPNLNGETTVSFLMIPKSYPVFSKLDNIFQIKDKAWFSIGLANLILFETEEKTKAIIEYLNKEQYLTGHETWKLNNGVLNTPPEISFKKNGGKYLDIKLSKYLPKDIVFIVSEFLMTTKNILTAAKKFTPYYYEEFFRILNESKQLISDVSYLLGDKEFIPGKALQETDITGNTHNILYDRLGRLIQFNSALSYVYSQCYTGTFPLLDHTGIIRRYSLLGVGSAIGSLYEILCQLEEAFFSLDLKKAITENYNTKTIKSKSNYFNTNPNRHKISLWKNDSVRKEAIKYINLDSYSSSRESDLFFSRFSFFSGRLGFREYDFSATAATQVLVQASSIKWNVINYTHEIIHNHVRTILNSIIEVRNLDQLSFLKDQLIKIDKIDSSNNLNCSYLDVFRFQIFLYCINSQYFGSLSANWPKEKYNSYQVEKKEWRLPDEFGLLKLVQNNYKDISEIFVHAIDFAYIYSYKTSEYLDSIWNSWATVTTVAINLDQYILRSLLVISTTKNDIIDVKSRFIECVKEFVQEIKKISLSSDFKPFFENIIESFENEKGIIDYNKPLLEDLRFRFYNCVRISDLVCNFFIGKMQKFLNRNDKNILFGSEKTREYYEGGAFTNKTYELTQEEFEPIQVISKVRFALSQLLNTTEKIKSGHNQFSERESAWILVTLSSINHE